MANIGNNQPVVGIKKLVVFYIAGNVEIGTRGYGGTNQEAACTTTKGYFFNRFAR